MDSFGMKRKTQLSCLFKFQNLTFLVVIFANTCNIVSRYSCFFRIFNSNTTKKKYMILHTVSYFIQFSKNQQFWVLKRMYFLLWRRGEEEKVEKGTWKEMEVILILTVKRAFNCELLDLKSKPHSGCTQRNRKRQYTCLRRRSWRTIYIFCSTVVVSYMRWLVVCSKNYCLL